MFGRPVQRALTRACRGGPVLLLVCGLAFSGCGRTPPVAPELPAQPWEGKPARVLEEDVGLVRHGEKVRRRYTASRRHTIQVDFYPYLDALRKERKRAPAARAEEKSEARRAA